LRYRATVAYLGTFFHGWQRQKNASRTVQEVMETALGQFFEEPVAIHAAGRTDAGVHADGQVVHFDARGKPPERIIAGANGILPWDARVLEVGQVRPDFHARFDATRKRYVYRFVRGRWLAPKVALTAARISARADAEAMADGAARLRGRHDFFAFSTNGTPQESTARTLFASEVREEGSGIVLTFEADGFLRGMARAFAGTLSDIARGKYPPSLIDEILGTGDKSLVRPKASARGLTLEAVYYG
jgi:tRNA pseudouridine38-40 synthase